MAQTELVILESGQHLVPGSNAFDDIHRVQKPSGEVHVVEIFGRYESVEYVDGDLGPIDPSLDLPENVDYIDFRGAAMNQPLLAIDLEDRTGFCYHASLDRLTPKTRFTKDEIDLIHTTYALECVLRMRTPTKGDFWVTPPR